MKKLAAALEPLSTGCLDRSRFAAHLLGMALLPDELMIGGVALRKRRKGGERKNAIKITRRDATF